MEIPISVPAFRLSSSSRRVTSPLPMLTLTALIGFVFSFLPVVFFASFSVFPIVFSSATPSWSFRISPFNPSRGEKRKKLQSKSGPEPRPARKIYNPNPLVLLVLLLSSPHGKAGSAGKHTLTPFTLNLRRALPTISSRFQPFRKAIQLHVWSHVRHFVSLPALNPCSP